MISVKIYKNLNETIHGFRVTGHAGFSAKGSDIVCSAVSVLVINTVNSIERLTDEKTYVTVDEKEGIIDCSFPDRKGGAVDRDAELLVRSMLLGLSDLERKYGKFIRITEEAPNG